MTNNTDLPVSRADSDTHCRLETNKYKRFFQATPHWKWKREKLPDLMERAKENESHRWALLFGHLAFLDLVAVLPCNTDWSLRIELALRHDDVQRGLVGRILGRYGARTLVLTDSYLHPEDQFMPKDEIWAVKPEEPQTQPQTEKQ